MDYEGRSLKSQMKQANKANARFAFIIGEDELQRDCGSLRNMKDRDVEQVEIPLTADDIFKALQ